MGNGVGGRAGTNGQGCTGGDARVKGIAKDTQALRSAAALRKEKQAQTSDRFRHSTDSEVVLEVLPRRSEVLYQFIVTAQFGDFADLTSAR